VRRSPVLLCLLALACGKSRGDHSAPAEAHDAGRAVAAATPDAAAAAPAPAPPDAGVEAIPGEDFTPQAVLLFQVAACGEFPDQPLPEHFATRTITHHCEVMRKSMDEYRNGWLAKATPFLADLRPADLPPTVVYPFGGGDLLTALSTYPDATEYTTISLEGSGDPRAIDHAHGEELSEALALHREQLRQVVQMGWAQTVTLHAQNAIALPGELISALAALAVHGYEPVSLRYFRIEPDGSIHYLTAEDRIDYQKNGPRPRKATHMSVSVDYFNDAELRFRKAGDPSAPIKIHRHIAFNLADDHMKKDPRLVLHLEAKGPVAMMTKASGYHFWESYFTVIRDYVVKNMVFMISDSTGLPPKIARAGGFVQETYGTFKGAYHENGGEKAEKDLAEMWADQPTRKLPMRYGYFDVDRRNNMMVTRKATPK